MGRSSDVLVNDDHADGISEREGPVLRQAILCHDGHDFERGARRRRALALQQEDLIDEEALQLHLECSDAEAEYPRTGR